MHVGARVALIASIMSGVHVFLAWPEFVLTFFEKKVPGLLFPQHVHESACRTSWVVRNPFSFRIAMH